MSLYYIGVYIISGLTNNFTYIIGAVMMVVNVIVLLIYLQSER